MKTVILKSPQIKRQWFIVDATGKPVGRVAAKVARVLMGKHKADYTPHLDCGDYVIIVNAEKAVFTGRKEDTKIYYQYSGYVGGMKATPFKQMAAKKPEFPLEKAVKGMLPKNKLAKLMFKKLYVFKGPEHNFKTRTVTPLEI